LFAILTAEYGLCDPPHNVLRILTCQEQ